jgi:hypothetical protein
MIWQVRLRVGTVDRLVACPSPDRAIEAACNPIAYGYEVYGIETEPPAHSIGRDIITRVFEIWMKEKSAFNQE